MDFATLLGIVSGIGLVVASILLNSGLDLFWSAPSAMIVGGATIAAIMIAYPANEVARVMGLFLKVFLVKKANLDDLIDNMVMINNVARKGGILAIESKLKDVTHEFLEKGLQLTVDGKDEATVSALLKRELTQIQKSHKDGWEIFNDMGKFAPAFGMVGTLIGLIQMLADLADVGSVGPKMAVALITTFYGALIANLIFIPMTVKLKRRSASDTLEMTLILEGISYIRKGVNPRFMKEILQSNVAATLGKKVKQDGEDSSKSGKGKKPKK